MNINWLHVQNIIALTWTMHTQFVWLTLSASCKSHMVDCILFEKENDFRMAFVLAISQLTWESAHEVHLKYNI